MVRVVVNDRRAVRHLADQLEAAGGAGELVQALFRGLARNAEKFRCCAAGEGVEHIVAAGHRERDLCIFLSVDVNGKAVVAVFVADLGRINVCIGRCAEGADAAVDVRDGAHRVRVVVVDNDQTVHRSQLCKLVERVDDVVDVLEEVEVILLDVQDDRNGRREAQEGIGVLAALRNEAALAADAERAADGGQVAADHDRRVHLRLDGHHGHHRGRGSLAVGTGEADDIVVVAHDVAPGLCALHDRDAELVCADDLGVFVVNGGGAHDQGRALDVLRPVLIGDRGAERLKTRGDVGAQAVGAGDRHTLAQQKLCERVHGYAADADEVNSFLIFNIGLDRQGHFP